MPTVQFTIDVEDIVDRQSLCDLWMELLDDGWRGQLQGVGPDVSLVKLQMFLDPSDAAGAMQALEAKIGDKHLVMGGKPVIMTAAEYDATYGAA